MHVSDANAVWAAHLAEWAIPDEILAQAPTSPWIHPVSLFDVDPTDRARTTISEQRALEALPIGGSVLDIGCGGGKAAFALVPPAGEVVGVDHQQGMLDRFAAIADELGVRHTEILGDWPEVASHTPAADVVTCHHVAYNVSNLAMFVRELDTHARSRVVLELPNRHPLSDLNPAWRHFWGLERPDGPTAEDALAVVRSCGVDAHLETFAESMGREGLPFDEQVEHLRIRLCLPSSRDGEVAAWLREQGPSGPRAMATIWWNSTTATVATTKGTI